MKRKTIMILLLICVVMLVAFERVPQVPSVNKRQEEADCVREWFSCNNLGNHTVTEPIELYSLSGNPVAVMFKVDKDGYVIINAQNYDVMEYSFDSAPKIASEKKNVYNGFLEYYEEDGNRLIDIQTNDIVEKNQIKDFFSNISINCEPNATLADKTTVLREQKECFRTCDMEKALSVRNGYFESGDLNHSLASWGVTGITCQVDCAAIVLKYLYDYKSSQFLPLGYTNNSDVQNYLCNNGYLVNNPMWSTNVVNGGTEGGVSFSGMNAYLFDRGVFSYSACFETYSFNRIKTLIDDDCPVVHASKGKIPNNTWGEQAHAYVIHGYMVGYDGVPFIIVNDTFGSSNVSINAKSYYHPTTYDGIWYIN